MCVCVCVCVFVCRLGGWVLFGAVFIGNKKIIGNKKNEK